MVPTLRVENLKIKYHIRNGTFTAVRDVSFTVNQGEIVGIVGESGSGKSSVASALMRLLPPNGEITSGKILLKDRDLRLLQDDQMRRIRGNEMSMIFQDPMTCLNPVFNIEKQMVEVIMSHSSKSLVSRKEAVNSVIQMLERVGIPDASKRIKDFPHQFSGGMRQRIMIATALLTDPSLLIADEPTSALDVTLEAQITELIRSLRDETQTAVLYITHDLGVVAQLCDHVIVLYAGNIVESSPIQQIYTKPLHPYTRALLNSHPSQDSRPSRLKTIRGHVASKKTKSTGCKFAAYCEMSQKVCFVEEPKLYKVDVRQVSCHIYDSVYTHEK